MLIKPQSRANCHSTWYERPTGACLCQKLLGFTLQSQPDFVLTPWRRRRCSLARATARDYSRGSTGSLSRARTPNASCTRRSGCRCTNRSRPSIPSANSRSASERFPESPRSRSRSRAARVGTQRFFMTRRPTQRARQAGWPRYARAAEEHYVFHDLARPGVRREYSDRSVKAHPLQPRWMGYMARRRRSRHSGTCRLNRSIHATFFDRCVLTTWSSSFVRA